MKAKSIFDLKTDLKGNDKEVWMIHDAESFGVWFNKQPVPDRIRIENITVRDRQSGSLTRQQRQVLLNTGTLSGIKITMDDMYQQHLHMITLYVRMAINDGSLEKAVDSGKLSAKDARKLIEAAAGRIPQSLLEAI